MRAASCYLREQKWYGRQELISMLPCDEERAGKIIDRLCLMGCLNKIGKNTALTDINELSISDINIPGDTADDGEAGYVLTYVGVIVVDNIVFMCYPKYFLSGKPSLGQMRQIFRVIDRYNSAGKKDLKLLSGFEQDVKFNLLPVILFLLKDYYEYGIYANDDELIEVNGEGAILWDKTINDSVAFILGERPYYFDIYNKKTISEEDNLISRLHKVILDECSDFLVNLGLSELLSVEELHLTDETRELLGDDETLANAVLKELDRQFNTRKQLLLRTIYSYILNYDGRAEEERVSFYGTSCFYDVWEKVCAYVFNDRLHCALSDLPYGSLPYEVKKDGTLLIDLIERPLWKENREGSVGIEAAGTLIPDTIALEVIDDKRYFVIFDAKYYNMDFDERNQTLSGQPGIESITKQYLYQLAYREFLKRHRVDYIGNCFLMPVEKEELEIKGSVSLKMFHEIPVEPKLVPIQICLLPAHKMYEHYLRGRRLSLRELRLSYR